MIGNMASKRISVALVFAMVLSIFSTNYIAFGAEAASSSVSFTDIGKSYAKDEVTALVEKGILGGYSDGSFKPSNSITRAELAKVLVLALGKEQDAASAAPFKDVDSNSWYNGYVGALVKSGITQGVSADQFAPNKTVTREELAVFFVRAFGLEQAAKAVALDEKLADLSTVSAWAKSSVSFAYQIGFIKGVANADGTTRFNPAGVADRQALARLAYEFVFNKTTYELAAASLGAAATPAPSAAPTPTNPPKSSDSSSGGNSGGNNGGNNGGSTSTSINSAGEHTLGAVTGDVRIYTANVTLKNTTISGNLYLETSIGNGDVTLQNVTVSGSTTINGGGPNSIHVQNSTLATVIVDKQDGSIRLVLENETDVQQVTIRSGAIIETQPGVGQVGNINIASNVPHNAQVSLNGVFNSVSVYAEQAAITLGENGSIGELNVFASALNSVFHLEQGSNVANAVLDAIVSFLGQGSITDAVVNADGVDFSSLPSQPNLQADPAVSSIIAEPALGFELSAIGATRQIVATGVKYTANAKDITTHSNWTSSDASVAEVVYGKVKAVGEGTTFITATYGLYNVQVPVTVAVYEQGYPTISAVQVTNGAVDVAFDQQVDDVSLSDFAISATLNGAAYELSGLQYANGKITFNPVQSYGSTLYVHVEANEAKTKFAGSQSGAVKLTGFGGTINDVARNPVANLTIEFRKGLGATSGPVVGTAVTDANGRYYIYLAPGIYTGELGGVGTPYVTTYMTAVSAVNVNNQNENQTAIGIPSENETRIVLTWGKDPADLDSHLIGPAVQGGIFHTWYADKAYYYNNSKIADLDLDDTSSYGPETTTIRKDTNGTYTFYVHHYSGASTISASGAKIEVYRGSSPTPIKVYEVPTDRGNEIYWTVFTMTITDGQVTFTDVNAFSNTNPVRGLNLVDNNQRPTEEPEQEEEPEQQPEQEQQPDPQTAP
ncbi:hypothetical protein BBD42_05270 [Paenibacillus sp. BIHB 4019]|uniref:SLH domain-containing protein n=2 Tax=Paenibacillus sp. BIHB 4019 TaxID=1870819 RepID=A0A1B2DE14_9BACL|nr:hypothetical protein BBD42_05270 [Paenibacillus sp. BIHB 4019]